MAKNILIVDDSATMRKIIMRGIRQAGIENADRATLREALTHQSGIYDYLGSDGFWEEVDGGRTTSWTAEEALQYLQCLCLAVSGSCLGWSSGGSLIGAFAHAQASGSRFSRKSSYRASVDRKLVLRDVHMDVHAYVCF